MTLFVALALLALTFVASTNAVCSDVGSGDVGTLIEAGGNCSNAKRAFGFRREGFGNPQIVIVGFNGASEIIDGRVFDDPDNVNNFVRAAFTDLDRASLNGHSFTTGCFCEVDDTCPVSNVTTSCDNGYVIQTNNDPICVKFGSGLQLTAESDGRGETNLFLLPDEYLNVTINAGPLITYKRGGASTLNNGTILRGLALWDNTTTTTPNPRGVFFSACGPFIVQDGLSGKRKRTLTVRADTTASAVFQPAAALTPAPTTPVTASGDPHLSGAHGIKFDVFGAPGANYSLLVAPAFEVNMQLAHRGPELRFMTAMSVLYRGKSFTITPWTVKAKSNELIAHFESLGSKVSIEDNRVITIELCAAHTISFAIDHAGRENNLNGYLNFRMDVPGCHDAYGGLLGQTYQCKYATEKFEWSRDREDDFRIATLDTASGSYSPTVSCANEDEYLGGPMSADSFSTKADALL